MPTGIVHVGGRERLSRYELMQRAAVVRWIDPDLIRPGRQADAASPNPDPPTSRSNTSRLAAPFPPSNDRRRGGPDNGVRPSLARHASDGDSTLRTELDTQLTVRK